MNKILYKVLGVYLIVIVFFYIYCSPVSSQKLLETVKCSLALTFMSYLCVWSKKFDKFFSSNHVPKYISEFSKTGMLVFVIPLTILSVFAFVRILTTKNFVLTFFFLPTIFFIYNWKRVYEMACEDLENLKKYKESNE